jgi:predicted transcriptional regulator|tara:strand:+ start:3018 stop:4928 length:1911 start_codon:yes stop_codon:yes gene_type:complete
MLLTTFRSITRPAAHTSNLSWSEFVSEHLHNFDVRENKDGPLYSPATYALGGSRGDAGVAASTFIVLDIDNTAFANDVKRCSEQPTLPEDHADNLAGVSYAWHSTHTHSKDWPKWRLCVEVDRQILPSEWPAAWRGLWSLVGYDPNVDTTSRDLSRAYYKPSCPAATADSRFSGHQDGVPLSVDELLEAGADETEYPLGVTQGDVAGRNDQLKRMAGAGLNKGKSAREVANELIVHDFEHHHPPLFSDPREFNGSIDTAANALRFVQNIEGSIVAHIGAGGTTIEPIAQVPSNVGAWTFAGDLQAPIYLVDQIIRRGNLYALSGHSNAGKTAIMLDLACSIATGRTFAGEPSEQSKVLFFAGENPEDLKGRVQGWVRHNDADIETLESNLHFKVGSSHNIAEMSEQVIEDCLTNQYSLLIFDSKTVFYSGDAEDDNNQAAADALEYRAILDALPEDNRPAIIVLCHVPKSAGHDAIIPRGGGGFLNVIDTNLACYKRGEGATELYICSKIRGKDFGSRFFDLKSHDLPLIDNKGRPLNTVVAVPCDGEVLEAEAVRTERLVLRILDRDNTASLANIAHELDTNRSMIQRCIKQLEGFGLIAKNGRYPTITKKGREDLLELDSAVSDVSSAVSRPWS